MTQIPTRIKTSKPESDFDANLEESLLSYAGFLSQIINKGIKFTDNFNAEFVTIPDTGIADTQNNVLHTLKRVPSGFIVTKIDAGGVVYDSGSVWTTTEIFIKCSVANANVTFMIF